jgi:hypothetical protein
MERIFHHYDLWEDYHAGMYNESKDGRSERVQRAVNILGTPDICEKAMNMVVDQWQISTEYNLSNAGINRKAWLGQAACCCYDGIHEDEVREAWGILSESQRKTANAIAGKVIKKWILEREAAEALQVAFY